MTGNQAKRQREHDTYRKDPAQDKNEDKNEDKNASYNASKKVRRMGGFDQPPPPPLPPPAQTPSGPSNLSQIMVPPPSPPAPISTPSSNLKSKSKSSKQPRACPPPPTQDEQDMTSLGLPSTFSSSKGKHVPDANVSAAKVASKRTYRQYMNRKGGFNRSLDKP